MARYFFNFYNGVQGFDDVGTECADVGEVRAEAVEGLQQLLAGVLLESSNTFSMTINVTDESGKTVMIVTNMASVETIVGSSLLPG